MLKVVRPIVKKRSSSARLTADKFYQDSNPTIENHEFKEREYSPDSIASQFELRRRGNIDDRYGA